MLFDLKGVGIDLNLVMEILERCAKAMLKNQLGYLSSRGSDRSPYWYLVPQRNMQDHIIVGRILVMTMVKPVPGSEVNFHRSRLLGGVAPADRGVGKVGPLFTVPPALENDRDGLTIGGA